MNEVQSEYPSLVLHRASVTLHFLQKDLVKAPSAPDLQSSVEFRSFENDLVAHAFQAIPPFASSIVPPWFRASIIYPSSVRFESEGQNIELLASNTERRVRVLPSYTAFLSGIWVYHLTFRPDDDYFNEYDVIKLVKLYAGREEVTSPANQIVFDVVGRGKQSLADLIHIAFGDRPHLDPRPVAGTIEAVTSADHLHAAQWEILWKIIELLPGRKGEAISALKGILDKGDAAAKMLKAVGGIIQGILNFERTDAAELVDVFEPTVRETDGLMRIHKGNLMYICSEDGAFDVVWDRIGNSPYLLIPHAVLLHNECLADTAEHALRDAQRTRSVAQITNLQASANLALNREMLPNVFHYSTERLLFERGSQSRGLSDRLEALHRQLREIDVRLEANRSRRERRAETVMQLILGIVSLLAVKEVVFSLLDNFSTLGESLAWRWGTFGGVVLALAVIIVCVSF